MMRGGTGAPDCTACKFRPACFFGGELKGQSLDAFMPSRIANRYRKGQVVFLEGTPPMGIHLVEKGRVRVYQADRRGHQLTVHVASPGDLVGNISLLAEESYTANAEALEDSVISFIEKEVYLALLNRHPGLMVRVLRTLARSAKRLSQLAGDMAMDDSRQRVVNLLYGLMVQYGTFGGRDATLAMELTRGEIGHLAGLAEETVIRILTGLEKEGLLVSRGRQITIKDPKRLERDATFPRKVA